MDEVYWGYEGLAEAARPSPNTEVTIHVSKDLPFASGAKMAQDFDLKLIPAEWGTWKPGLEPCPGADGGIDAGPRPPPSSGGCGSVPSTTSLAAAGLVLLLLALRRGASSPR